MSMNENIKPAIVQNQQSNSAAPANEIDLMALFGALLDRKIFIAMVTAVFMVVGVAVAIFSTPIYKAAQCQVLMTWLACLKVALNQSLKLSY